METSFKTLKVKFIEEPKIRLTQDGKSTYRRWIVDDENGIKYRFNTGTENNLELDSLMEDKLIPYSNIIMDKSQEINGKLHKWNEIYIPEEFGGLEYERKEYVPLSKKLKEKESIKI